MTTPQYAGNQGDQPATTLIVGGGIVGATTALYLARAGVKAGEGAGTLAPFLREAAPQHRDQARFVDSDARRCGGRYLQLLDGDETGAQGIVDVMRIVGEAVGRIDNLGLKQRSAGRSAIAFTQTASRAAGTPALT